MITNTLTKELIDINTNLLRFPGEGADKADRLLEMMEEVLCLVDEEAGDLVEHPVIQEAYELVEECLPEEQRLTANDSFELA